MLRPSKPFVISIILVLLAIATGVYLFDQASESIGDIRPAFFTPEKTLNTILREGTQQASSAGNTDAPLPEGETYSGPVELPEGFQISVYTDGLQKPRDLQMSPGGTLLVSDPSAGTIWLLPDGNQDGIADSNVALLENLSNPHGLAFHDGWLYVATETEIFRVRWNEAESAVGEREPILDLPAGGRHTTRTIVFDDQDRMYVSLGSRCDTCFEEHPWIGTVISADDLGNNPQTFSVGLRNAVFMQVHPDTNQVWVTEMGRDFLGDNTPPDEINILQRGAHYGWPICYGDQTYDTEFGQRTPEFCENTLPPAYNLQAHVAPLGLTFINSSQFPEEWQGDLLVALHGSWNRSVPVGYKVIRLDVENGTDVVGQDDFLTGFLQGREAIGRPVDVEFDANGTLYVSDDKSGAVYRVFRPNN